MGGVVRGGAAAGDVPREAGFRRPVGELLEALYGGGAPRSTCATTWGGPPMRGRVGTWLPLRALVDRATLDGANGPVRLLDAVGHDYPSRTVRSARCERACLP